MGDFKMPELKSINPKIIIFGVVLAVVVFMASQSLFIVDQTEQGVVLRLGKYNRMVDPGLNFKIPFGIEKKFIVPTQTVLKEEFGFRTIDAYHNRTVYSERSFAQESSMLTGDLNIVEVEWIIQYKIADPVQWLFKVERPTRTIRDISQSIINQLIGDRGILDVIGAERGAIELQGQDMMNELFKKYELGVLVTTVKLQNIVPPEGEVQSAFEDVNKAIQDRSRLINEGKQAYNEQIPKANGEAEATIQQAKGYAVERINKADGDVARFKKVLTEYRRNPEVTRTRLYYEMYEEVFGVDASVELIDKNLSNFIPLKTMK